MRHNLQWKAWTRACGHRHQSQHSVLLNKSTAKIKSFTIVLSVFTGGFNAFASQFPVLCEQTAASPARSPVLSVSVSTSLPISFSQQNARPQNIQLRTPSCKDESNAFGPPVELLPHLVLGCERDSANLSILRQMGITAVLNVSHNLPNHFESLFEYLGIPVEDSYQADLLSNLHTAFAFIGTYIIQ